MVIADALLYIFTKMFIELNKELSEMKAITYYRCYLTKCFACL